MTRPVDISAWGNEPPRWVLLLAEAVRREGTRTKVAAIIGYDRASVGTALTNSYPSPSTDGIERAVLRAFDSDSKEASDAPAQ
ncbi:MAG TPA: hypothetical protein VNV36_06055 [Pseudomonas sp.]|uniref:hypothetical protein n=1 Tax=Pseudomonas sp. TaxID=306 RepID=UPI002CA7967E|nr:hypothetical protein [Pseudomonas sp.]HWH86321.1 hypothetical protein [Pseudomonas sp.]